MKRITSILLALVMAISMLTMPVGAAETTEEPIVKILTLSDYQKWLPSYSGDDWATLQTQLRALVNGAYDAGVDPDYMIFGGDYSCLDSVDLSSTGMSQVNSIIRSKWSNLTDDKMINVQGNHDPAGTPGLTETGPVEFDDFIVYVIREDDYPSKQGDASVKDVVEATVEDLEIWLQEKIDEEETRPIFLATHTGLHYDIDRTDGNNQFAYILFDALNEAAKYLDIVFLFGHNHTNGDEQVGGSVTCFQKGDTLNVCTETSIANRSGKTSVLNFTYMNYGYIGYIGDINNNPTSITPTDMLTISELYLFEDRIEVYRYTSKGLAEEYVVTLDRDYYDEVNFGDEYTLSYESNGGTKILSQKTTQAWNTVVRTAPVKSGEEFLYWSTKEDGTGNRYQPGDSIYVAADTTLYAQYAGGTSTGDSAVFELTEELKAGETYLLTWNSELYSDEGTRYALTNGSANVTTMNDSWVSEDGAKIAIPSNVNTSPYQWVVGGSDGRYTFWNAATKNYLAYANSALSFAASSSDSCLWNIVMNSGSTDDRAPAGIVLCNLVPYSNDSAFVRYSVGGGQLKMGTKSKSTDTANSDVTIYKMTSDSDQGWHEHAFDTYASDENATCYTDGTQSRTCECGVVETKPLKDSKVDHDYIYGEEIVSDVMNHYAVCRFCNDMEKEAHYGGTATTDKKAQCEVCGIEYGDYAEKVKLPYKDVEEDAWYYGAVEYTYLKGLMTGKSETIFAPDENLARGQFASILYRIEGSPKMEFKPEFADVEDGVWYTAPILWAKANGIVNGYANGNFGPGDMITREQMVIMMYNYAASKGYDMSANDDLTGYIDAASVSDYALEEMQWAVGVGLITGKDNGTRLDPQGNTTRSEAAVIIQGFCTAGEEIASFDVVADEDTVISDVVFEGPVVINSNEEGGRLVFNNCTFSQDVTFNGKVGNIVMFGTDCIFEEGVDVTIASDEKEATLETMLPRVMTFVPVNVIVENMGTVVALGQDSLMKDGDVLQIENCDKALSEDGESFVDFDKEADYDCLAIAQWWEDGEMVEISYAFKG